MRKFSYRQKLFLIILLLFAERFCFAQVAVMDISKADISMKEQAKPLLILLSAKWCKYCQMQKNQLRRNKKFIKRSNSFYYVEFDAESEEDILFNGQRYRFKTNGATTGVNELAAALSGSEFLAFPTWVLLDKNYRMLFRYNGVLMPKKMDELLTVIDKIDTN